jgi:hypothetical protein
MSHASFAHASFAILFSLVAVPFGLLIHPNSISFLVLFALIFNRYGSRDLHNPLHGAGYCLDLELHAHVLHHVLHMLRL